MNRLFSASHAPTETDKLESCLFYVIGNPDLRQSADSAQLVTLDETASRSDAASISSEISYSFDCCLPTAKFDVSRSKGRRTAGEEKGGGDDDDRICESVEHSRLLNPAGALETT